MTQIELYRSYYNRVEDIAKRYNVNQFTLFEVWLKGVFDGLSPDAALFGVRRACAMLRPDIPDDYTLTIEAANSILDGMEGFRA